jgi:hypothetical protein
MPFALTCDCGARFDVDDLQAGKDVLCPECRGPVRAPERAAPPRLSLWALASVVLAVFGAFTLVGTVAAILAGVCALMIIHRQPDRLTGNGVALGGIAAGIVFSGLTLALLARPGVVPVAAWARQRGMAGQVDTTGTPEMMSRTGDVVVSRPSDDWGRARNDRTDDPVVGELQQKRELLLVNLGRHAYVDVFRDTTNTGHTLQQYGEILEQDINPPRTPLLGEDDTPRFRTAPGRPGWPGVVVLEGNRPFRPTSEQVTDLAPVDGHDVRQWEYVQPRGGQKWMFIIRVYKKRGPVPTPIHVVRAYTPLRRFEANEEELRRILDSVRIPQ